MGKNMTELKNALDLLEPIIRWEQGDLDPGVRDGPEMVELFQRLIDTGLAWELQGIYGRTAKRLIDAGLCHEPGAAPVAEVVEPRLLSTIAREIRHNWKKVNFAAIPYLRAMSDLRDIHDDYYADTAVSVVAYFLSNATTWRGDTARRVKAELNAMLKAA